MDGNFKFQDLARVPASEAISGREIECNESNVDSDF
jgi:hypothetical protein